MYSFISGAQTFFIAPPGQTISINLYPSYKVVVVVGLDLQAASSLKSVRSFAPHKLLSIRRQEAQVSGLVSEQEHTAR